MTPEAVRKPWEQEMAARSGWSFATFDSVDSFWVHDPKDFQNLLSDPEWAGGKFRETEATYGNLESAVVIVGWDTVYLEDGEIVNTTPRE
jgi:hypothetical protein